MFLKLWITPCCWNLTVGSVYYPEVWKIMMNLVTQNFLIKKLSCIVNTSFSTGLHYNRISANRNVLFCNNDIHETYNKLLKFLSPLEISLMVNKTYM
jgi:hypothetical protein